MLSFYLSSRNGYNRKTFASLLPLLLYCLLGLPSPVQAQSIAKQGEEFLKKNAQRKEVIVTESGLQYHILKPGNHLRAGKRDKIKVHYQGKHINGEVFDSTFGGEPAQFRLSKMIKGWKEGLQLIGEGGRIVLYVPPKLAYGMRGSGRSIKRNETLIFIIDLVEIISKR